MPTGRQLRERMRGHRNILDWVEELEERLAVLESMQPKPAKKAVAPAKHNEK